jgi:antitoxin MazE
MKNPPEGFVLTISGVVITSHLSVREARKGSVMRKTLIQVGNSLGLVIERPVLDLLNITRDTVLEVSTDGRRLIIEPASPVSSLNLVAASATDGESPDFGDPAFTVQVLDALESQFHISNERFRRLHHARNYENTIKAHWAYAANRPSRFQAGGSNELTARRLHSCLQALEAGETWEAAIALATNQFPR